MKTSTRRFLLSAIVLSACAITAEVRSQDRLTIDTTPKSGVTDPATGLPVGARAQPIDPATGLPISAHPKPGGYDLVITNGTFQMGGKTLPATLANVVDALRDMYPESTIAMPPTLAKVQVSDLKLRTGNVWESLEAVCVATDGKFEWVGPGGNTVFTSRLQAGVSPSLIGAVDPQTGLTSWGRANNGLFVLREASPAPETMRTVEAFNIAPYLEFTRRQAFSAGAKNESPEATQKRVEASLEQVKAMISDTIVLAGASEPPAFQFHAGAALLVVVGNRDAVEVARKVIYALPGQAGMGGNNSGFGGTAPAGGLSPENDAFRRRYGLDRLPPSGTPGDKPPDDPAQAPH